MIKLFLHIGTEKTGSSFLQYALVHNRNWLETNGIHLPSGGKWEREMKAGRISAGNGDGLKKALKQGKQSKIRDLIFKYKKEATEKNCTSILITNENLLEYFSFHKNWHFFKELCDELHIYIQPLLLIIRDPVEHALSLYKHRAKSGKSGKLEDWVKSGYGFPRHLESLFQLAEAGHLNLAMYKYQKDSDHLLKLFFRDWLSLSDQPTIQAKQVNPSLTLSELAFIRHVYQVKPKLVPYFYKELVKLSQSDKGDDQPFQDYARDFLNHYLAHYNALWERANQYLNGEECLNFPDGRIWQSQPKLNLNFSSKQIQTINQFWFNTGKISFKIHFFGNHYIRPFLARLKWGFLNTIYRYE